ncbi:MAG TPA: hypothetical protein PK078_15535 [Anaerolineales bacterium]|nr:hypothetical protein [Anaerolineales bacterium]HNA90523.1 hypothetical protein [Anaerolineales bacterium]
MTIPSLLFGLALALMVGALFHAVRGGNGWRLLLCFGLSIAGFALAQWLGMFFGISFYAVGVLDIGFGVLGSIIVLVIGDWLSRIEPEKKSGV